MTTHYALCSFEGTGVCDYGCSELRERIAARLKFINEAFALRELREWPNDRLHNARVAYELYGWSFDRRDAAMIAAEATPQEQAK